MSAQAQQQTKNNPYKAMIGERFAEFMKNNNKIVDTLFYLKDRWQDEKEYEDFADYEKAAKDAFIDTPYTVHSMTNGFKLEIRERSSLNQLTLKINQSSYTMKVL